MAEVIWTIKAVEQVEQIGSYIEKDSPAKLVGSSNSSSRRRASSRSMHGSAR